MAKQFDHLFEEITSFENLWLASKWAAKRKRSQVEVADFAVNADWRILEIQAAERWRLAHAGLGDRAVSRNNVSAAPEEGNQKLTFPLEGVISEISLNIKIS